MINITRSLQNTCTKRTCKKIVALMKKLNKSQEMFSPQSIRKLEQLCSSSSVGGNYKTCFLINEFVKFIKTHILDKYKSGHTQKVFRGINDMVEYLYIKDNKIFIDLGKKWKDVNEMKKRKEQQSMLNKLPTPMDKIRKLKENNEGNEISSTNQQNPNGEILYPTAPPSNHVNSDELIIESPSNSSPVNNLFNNMDNLELNVPSISTEEMEYLNSMQEALSAGFKSLEAYENFKKNGVNGMQEAFSSGFKSLEAYENFKKNGVNGIEEAFSSGFKSLDAYENFKKNGISRLTEAADFGFDSVQDYDDYLKQMNEEINENQLNGDNERDNNQDLLGNMIRGSQQNDTSPPGFNHGNNSMLSQFNSLQQMIPSSGNDGNITPEIVFDDNEEVRSPMLTGYVDNLLGNPDATPQGPLSMNDLIQLGILSPNATNEDYTTYIQEQEMLGGNFRNNNNM